MNETIVDREEFINECVCLIDKALGSMSCRELVSAGEVTDVLLDARSLLAQTAVTV